MRVLFVFPDLSSTVTGYTGVVNYGLASLSAVLRQAGHDIRLYHMTHNPTEEEFRETVRSARPGLVAFSTNSHYARRLRNWTTWAHEASGAPVAVGGIHATLAPEHVSSLPGVHYTCVGEGEQPILELCDTLERGADATGVANWWARRGDDVVRNPARHLLQDLDSLPDPDLSIFDFDRLYPVRLGQFAYLMSRGCAFKCTYCSIPALGQVAPRDGMFWRFLTPKRAVEQLATLLARYMPDAKYVSLVDAIAFPHRKWLAEFAPLYRERIGLPVSCNLRADMVTEHTAGLLRDMGVKVTRMGVESGDEWMTREILKRHLKVDDIRSAFALLRQNGIKRWSYNMVGLPYETLAMAFKTVRLNAEIDPEQALAFIFYPYVGTELHQVCKKEGFLTDHEFDHYKVGVAVRMPQFQAGDILFMHRFFNLLIRVYRTAGRLPWGLGRPAVAILDRVLPSRWFPRAALVRLRETYRRTRHAAGEWLHFHAPPIYRLLGGRAPAWGPYESRATARGIAGPTPAHLSAGERPAVPGATGRAAA